MPAQLVASHLKTVWSCVTAYRCNCVLVGLLLRQCGSIEIKELVKGIDVVAQQGCCSLKFLMEHPTGLPVHSAPQIMGGLKGVLHGRGGAPQHYTETQGDKRSLPIIVHPRSCTVLPTKRGEYVCCTSGPHCRHTAIRALWPSVKQRPCLLAQTPQDVSQLGFCWQSPRADRTACLIQGVCNLLHFQAVQARNLGCWAACNWSTCTSDALQCSLAVLRSSLLCLECTCHTHMRGPTVPTGCLQSFSRLRSPA